MHILCFSHLRWNFVFQRPQHLLTRYAKHNPILYFEEPVPADSTGYREEQPMPNITVITPTLREGDRPEVALPGIINKVLADKQISDYAMWYYTPMAQEFTSHLSPKYIIYDVMDELSSFKFAPHNLKELEGQLYKKAGVVFTGGKSLYEAKKHRHKNIHMYPSSIDKTHFGQARTSNHIPEDQKDIRGKIFGFFGVIDERFDRDLIREVAMQRPDWQFVIIGPVVKINPEDLPRLPNIHYLGQKSYEQLPDYIAGWDIALIPFVIDESTKFISPTKTPEYLAAGLPVISTAITDVVTPYGEQNLVSIIHNAEEFINEAEKELNKGDRTDWLAQVDDFLKDNSWDHTFQQMHEKIKELD